MTELELSTQVLLIVLGAAIMLALLGLVVSVAMPASDRWNKRFFIAYFTVLVLYADKFVSIQFRIITADIFERKL